MPNYLNVGDVVDDGSDEDCNCIIGNDDDDDVDHDDHDDDDVDIYIMMKCLFVTKNHHFLL